VWDAKAVEKERTGLDSVLDRALDRALDQKDKERAEPVV
jgi:hypothetical protein